jgi:hypothetical protein
MCFENPRHRLVVFVAACLMGALPAFFPAAAQDAAETRLATLAASCREGSLASCRTALPLAVAAHANPPVYEDAETGERWSRAVTPPPPLQPLFVAFVRAVRARASDAATPVAEVRSLAAAFPADRTLSTRAEQALFARGDASELASALCSELESPATLARIRANVSATTRPAFADAVTQCQRDLPITRARTRYAALVDAIGNPESHPILDVWIRAERSALPRATSPEEVAAALLAQPPSTRERLASEVVTFLREGPEERRGAIDLFVTAVPESAVLVAYQREIADARTAEQARREAEARAAEQARFAEEERRLAAERAAEETRRIEEARRQAEARAAEQAQRIEEARREAEARAAEQARRAEEERRIAAERAAAAAREAARACHARCRTTADSCSTNNPAAVVTRCLPEFERCEQRCDR